MTGIGRGTRGRGGLRGPGAPLLALLLALGAGPARGDHPPVTIADLHGYREALEGKPGGRPVAVGFRELWSRPVDYQGKRVLVRGRLVRSFEQGAYGTFPALSESWALTPSRDPLCLVFPTGDDGRAGLLGEQVEFVGTFLRMIPYQGGDARRLAPLIVGDRPPVRALAPPAKPAGTFRFSKGDWMLGVGAAAVVAALLLGRHLRKPVARPLNVDLEVPPPTFEDGAAGPGDAGGWTPGGPAGQ